MAPLPSPVLNWLGTFIVATTLSSASSYESRLKLSILAPAWALGVWRLLSQGKRDSAAPALVAASSGSLFLSLEELSSINQVLWLRTLNVFYSSLKPQHATLVTAVAIWINFYGVVARPDASQSALVKMTRMFLPKHFFAGLKIEPRPELTLDDAKQSFSRAFRGLFIYNFSLHYIAALVGHTVKRMSGSKAAPLRTAFVQATKEALAVNLATSLACFSWVMGARVGGDLFGVFLIPLPLWILDARVRTTFCFLMVPWAVKFLSKAYALGDAVPVTLKVLLATLCLEGPLRETADLQTNSMGWLVSVAFGHAQKIMGRASGF